MASYTVFVLEYLFRYLDLVLGRNIGNLLELAVRKQEAYAVLTRIQRRKKENEETAALAKEIISEVKPRPSLTTESEEENE